MGGFFMPKIAKWPKKQAALKNREESNENGGENGGDLGN